MLPTVVWTVDGREVATENWRATTSIPGGYDNFDGSISERVARRFSTSISQGAVVRGQLEDGRPMWEGRLALNPSFKDGKAGLVASGYAAVAEKRKGRLLFQSRESGLWAPASGSPFADSDALNVKAETIEGGVRLGALQGSTVTSGATASVKLWAQGAMCRRLRGTINVVGTNTNWTLTVYAFTGPSGARSSIGTISLTSGTFDLTPSTPQDSLEIELAYTTTGTLAASIQIDIRDLRVNDLTTADSAEVHKVAKVVGAKCGYDVSGMRTGVSVDTASPDTWVEQAFFPAYESVDYATNLLADMNRRGSWSRTQDKTFVGQYTTVSFEPAVKTSAMNILPFDWSSGSHAEALTYLADVLDWRWRVGPNTGRGPLLDFGPWAKIWDVTLAGNTRSELQPQEIFNEVLGRYANHAGVQSEVRVKASPDPLAYHGITNTYEFSMGDVQLNDDTAENVARNLLVRLSVPRFAGRVEIAGARDINGGAPPFSVTAGDQLYVGDWGPQEALLLRVSQTEMTQESVTLGLEQPVNAFGMLALAAARKLRTPFGSVGRFAPVFHRGRYIGQLNP